MRGFEKKGENMIPKIIHLMWFGGGEYPEEIKKCLDSWKKNLPDYEIKKWDYDMAQKIDIPYLQDALKSKKWAFAADVVRLYALYKYGGVYMDADIFITGRFDQYMERGVHFFQEYHKNMPINDCIDSAGHRIGKKVIGCGIQAAFIIAEKGHPYIKMLLENYKLRHFELDEAGKVKKDEFIAPDIYAINLEKYGYIYRDEYQDLGCNVCVHPSYYVAGGPSELTTKAFAIHECAHSWFDYSYAQKIKNSVKKYIRAHMNLFKI